jgi:hypothetical protein
MVEQAMAQRVTDEEYQTPYTGLPARVKYGKFPPRPKSAPPRKTTRTDRDPPMTDPKLMDKGWLQIQERPIYGPFSKVGRAVPAVGDLGNSGAKGPGPGQYKAIDAFNKIQPREKFGKFLPARPQSAPPGRSNTGPGMYKLKYVEGNMPAPDFSVVKRRHVARSASKKDTEPGPGAYDAIYTLVEARKSGIKFLKAGHLPRFTEDAANKKKWVPPPGIYGIPVGEKHITRGARWSQIHGVGRSAMHGTY